MIYSYELEKTVLGGLLQNTHLWSNVSNFLTEKDFYSEDSQAHRSIFLLIKHALNNSETIDEVILIDRLDRLNVSFPDDIDLPEYIKGLAFYEVSEDVFLQSVKELKKYSVRREIHNACTKVQKHVNKVDPNTKYSDILEASDKLYNEPLKTFERGDHSFVNLFEMIPDMVEERGENPVTNFGMLGPYPSVNKIYGSLLLPGNITVVAARTGSGKTTVALDFATKVADHYDVPVLHFDNGEMSEEELAFRQVAALTKLPLFLIQTGRWRNSSWGELTSQQVVHRVRSCYKKLKKIKFFYENVAGMSPDDMASLVKRFYYSEVGRGNPLIFSFDYIKTDFSSMKNGGPSGWEKIAYMIDKFKQTIHRDICFDGKPQISMFTSVQTNRAGIVNNRSPDNIVEDESVVALGDAISHFCSHLFLLRKKVAEELILEGENFGTHKLINLKSRHLGEDIEGALNLVEMPDGTKKGNYINLDIKSFGVEDKGDLRDLVKYLSNTDISVEENEEDNDLPPSLR